VALDDLDHSGVDFEDAPAPTKDACAQQQANADVLPCEHTATATQAAPAELGDAGVQATVESRDFATQTSAAPSDVKAVALHLRFRIPIENPRPGGRQTELVNLYDYIRYTIRSSSPVAATLVDEAELTKALALARAYKSRLNARAEATECSADEMEAFLEAEVERRVAARIDAMATAHAIELRQAREEAAATVDATSVAHAQALRQAREGAAATVDATSLAHAQALRQAREGAAATVDATSLAHAQALRQAREAAAAKVDAASVANAQALAAVEAKASKQISSLNARIVGDRARREGKVKDARHLRQTVDRAQKSAHKQEARAEMEQARARVAQLNAANERAKFEELEKNSVRIAPQRIGSYKNAPFHPATRLRDILVRQNTLASGAARMAETTRLYSSSLAEDGRDVGLESGSERSILRWEKTTESLCIDLEGTELRAALHGQPRTKLWGLCDLSPDSRGPEQFGMAFEYAGCEYKRSGANSEAAASVGSAAAGDRVGGTELPGCLKGSAYGSAHGVRLGADGCPMADEWSRRVFTPMLEAYGSKYDANTSCYLRTCEVYSTPAQEICSPEFAFAEYGDVERESIVQTAHEGICSDAGGEVHKGGGLMETALPGKQWRQCGCHGLNLSLEKSVAFEKVGAQIRSVSTFCRGGNRHSKLCNHMRYIQQPELYQADARASNDYSPEVHQLYLDAHTRLRESGSFKVRSDSQTERVDVDDVEASIELVSDRMLFLKVKKGTDVRWEHE
jgi:hypothetical protein